MKRLFLCAAVIFLGGCATILSGKTQALSIDTPNAPGATCRGTDKAGKVYFWPSTPSTTTVNKGDGPMTIICKKKGFNPVVHEIDETLVGSFWGNILLGGGIGMIVDAASGAAQEYQSIVVIPLEPDENAPEEKKKEYRKLKQQIVEQLRQKLEAEKREAEQMRKTQEESFGPME